MLFILRKQRAAEVLPVEMSDDEYLLVARFLKFVRENKYGEITCKVHTAPNERTGGTLKKVDFYETYHDRLNMVVE